MSNTFGTRFRVTTFGESHGPALGAVIDGCPAGMELSEQDIQVQLDRRRPGQSSLVSARVEPDLVRILSGVEGGLTLGTPIALLIENRDVRSVDYAPFVDVPRPSHADYTYWVKYGRAVHSGGGRASGRETVARVAAGAVADKILRVQYGVKVVAWVSTVGGVEAPDLRDCVPDRKAVDATPVRCPDAETAAKMIREIEAVAAEGDSVGGVITCVCTGVPPGWGEPVFGKISANLAAAMLSIPAAKGFEIGSGFAGARMRGSEHNDLFVVKQSGGAVSAGDARTGRVRLGTVTNRSGGIQGGITNGEPVVFRVAFKPPATIAKPQKTVTYDGKPVILEGKGRHDPCVVPRAVPVVESMAALVLMDAALMAGM